MPSSFAVKEKISKTSPARRCLFNRPADEESNDKFVKRLLDEIHESYKAKWEFDFIADQPIETEGVKHRFTYERVNEDSVPGFYRISSYSPVCPPLPLHSLENYNKRTIDDEEMDSENVDPCRLHYRHYYSRYNTSRAFNNSYNSAEDSFEEEDEQLLNDSTSSSGSSESKMQTIKSAKNNNNVNLNDSCASTLTKLEDLTTYISDDDNDCANSSASLKSLSEHSLLRSSMFKNSVTPKKQAKLTG